MKIKVVQSDYDKVLSMPGRTHKKPLRPSWGVRKLLAAFSKPELKKACFSYKEYGMDKLDPKQPCLILMNHSSFLDLKICMSVFANRPFNIICTLDGFVGKEGLMRRIGCIPTTKFITDVMLLKDMKYAIDELGNSILMYPEASYSFDGTATPLPEGVGKCLKLLDVPVVMVKTYGAFLRDPLYNNLQIRDVKVSADITYLLSKEEVEEKSVQELNDILKEQFTFDNFKWQQEHLISVKEDFRADYLNRVLYKCPHCMKEGKTLGKDTKLICRECGATYELSEYGFLEKEDQKGVFNHIPEWYQWERREVRKELETGTYKLDVPVDIYVLNDMNCIHQIGEGNLIHDRNGFELTGLNGKLHYRQKPEASYSLYADYFWYEIGDMICIGNHKMLYYCFPKGCGDVVAKTRLATEELYKMIKDVS